MNIIDLTHTFSSQTPVFPGDPKVSLIQTAFINKDTYNDHSVTTQMHAGTHIDAPMHMVDGGKRIDELPLECFMGNAMLINAFGKKEIGADVLDGLEIKPRSIVLVHTGFDKYYEKSKYFDDSPFLTIELAREFAERNVKLVGLDFAGPDIDSSWPTHKILLEAEIPIIENLKNLDKLVSEKEFEIIALPLNLKADASPLRVVARIK